MNKYKHSILLERIVASHFQLSYVFQHVNKITY